MTNFLQNAVNILPALPLTVVTRDNVSIKPTELKMGRFNFVLIALYLGTCFFASMAVYTFCYFLAPYGVYGL